MPLYTALSKRNPYSRRKKLPGNELLLTLLQEGPLATLVGLTIWQLTRVTVMLKTILANQEMLIQRMLETLTEKHDRGA